jgi:hypothetical protein
MQYEKICKPPICEYSIAREKCVKPNPFIQYKSHCSRNNIPFSKCINNYNANKEYASYKACDYYKEYLRNNEAKLKQLLIDGPKKVGRPKKIKEPKEPKKEPKKTVKEPKKTVKEPKKEPKEPKKEPKEPKKEPKEPKKEPKKTVKEPKEPKKEPKTRGRPRKILLPKTSSSIFALSETIVKKPTSSSSIFTLSIPSKKERLSSSTFNLSNSSDKSFKSFETENIQPISKRKSSSSIKNITTPSSVSSNKSNIQLSSSTFKSFSSLDTKSTPKMRTLTSSNLEDDILNIQIKRKEMEDNLRSLIKKNKYLNNSSYNKKKIGKFIFPLMKINRMSNIEYRIKYYKILHKYIESRTKYNDNCLRLYKYLNSKPIYRIGNRIILDKQIGSDSKYGSVFLSHYRLTNKKFGKLFTFATKISDGLNSNNIKEYKVLKDLTNCVIKEECPHFPMSFGKLECTKQNIRDLHTIYSSDISPSFIKQNSSSFISLLSNLPKNIHNKNNLLITLNELAENDHDYFITLYYRDDKIIWNSLVQVILSLMFFHKYINAYHRDSHNGNFLYHKTKPGGYYHYNLYGKDFYLENIGFLWVIWDFGLIQPFSNSKLINNNKYGIGDNNTLLIIDYMKIIKTGYRHKEIDGYISNKYMFSSDIKTFINILYDELLKQEYISSTNIKQFPALDKDLIRILVNYGPNNTFKTEIGSNDFIINANKPYII